MSRSRGKLHAAKICPWCGTPTLERDEFTSENSPQQSGAVAYFCTLCHTGFSRRESPRAHFVNRMYALERQRRPPDNDHIQARKSGAVPLTERTSFELQRLEELLLAKRPHTRTSRDANAEQLKHVQVELARRGVVSRPGTLLYRIGEVYPPGSIPVKVLDSTGDSD